jgi:hypothetical protein
MSFNNKIQMVWRGEPSFAAVMRRSFCGLGELCVQKWL